MVISETVPLSLTIVSSSATPGSYDPGSARWQVGSVAAGQSVTLSVLEGTDHFLGGRLGYLARDVYEALGGEPGPEWLGG